MIKSFTPEQEKKEIQNSHLPSLTSTPLTALQGPHTAHCLHHTHLLCTACSTLPHCHWWGGVYLPPLPPTWEVWALEEWLSGNLTPPSQEGKALPLPHLSSLVGGGEPEGREEGQEGSGGLGPTYPLKFFCGENSGLTTLER